MLRIFATLASALVNNMADTTSKFSAVDPALGYLYQVRCALLWSLQKLKESPSFEASIETLDDVTFESHGIPTDLLQTKLHKNRGANLTDASPDIWKTLRIWLAAAESGQVTPGTSLYLVTTENAAPGTIAAYLKADGRDVDAALSLLEATAQTSTNATNTASYRAFLKASPEAKSAVIGKVVVVDGSPDIADLDNLLRLELFHAVDREHHEIFLSYLEGWWFRRSVTQLSNSHLEDRILSEELEAEMADLRDRFKQDSLPISDDLKNYELDDETVKAHEGLPFVQQVELATENSKRIAAAIRDYYRAFEQRSRWQREELLFVGDLEVYEKNLFEEWELVFAEIEDDLGRNPDEEEKLEAARIVLKWAETGTVTAKIKPGVTDPFITRGSLHILSNDLKIGWHPEFRDRLSHLLSGVDK